MTKDDLIIHTVQFIDSALEKQGGLLPAVYVHEAEEDGERVNVVPYKDGSADPALQQKMIIKFVRKMVKAGTFRGLVMVSEAWASKPMEGIEVELNKAMQPLGGLRPSQDPDRVEQLFAYIRGEDDSKASVVAWLMERDGKLVRRGKQVSHPEGTTVKSWLDDAFQE